MQIRLASAKDIDGIAHVHVASWQTTYPGIIADSVLSIRYISGLQGVPYYED
ncbi:hypothetical protein [Paenibacillus guangzhouensis]|uniref:hypothetical protein n=1 Tax=Paenibacillus guangzhouensis TaxID=1473112 RepID=UPI00187B1EE1|nr:hypothetical protein [Paenibacillus guangzhouensis]